MTYETNNKTVLILDSRFSEGLEQELEKDLTEVDGLLEGLPIEIASSESALKSLNHGCLGKQFDIILIGEFENKIKEYVLKLNHKYQGEKVFLYNNEPTSDKYLNFARTIRDIIQRLDELSYNQKEMVLAKV